MVPVAVETREHEVVDRASWPAVVGDFGKSVLDRWLEGPVVTGGLGVGCAHCEQKDARRQSDQVLFKK